MTNLGSLTLFNAYHFLHKPDGSWNLDNMDTVLGLGSDRILIRMDQQMPDEPEFDPTRFSNDDGLKDILRKHGFGQLVIHTGPSSQDTKAILAGPSSRTIHILAPAYFTHPAFSQEPNPTLAAISAAYVMQAGFSQDRLWPFDAVLEALDAGRLESIFAWIRILEHGGLRRDEVFVPLKSSLTIYRTVQVRR